MKLKFGVPCSKIKDRINDVDIHCSSESEAMAIAAGCILAGKEPEVYMQNSGLGHIVDICTSLYMPYEIPYPRLLLSRRVKPHHHSFMGKITEDILKLLQYRNIELVNQSWKE